MLPIAIVLPGILWIFQNVVGPLVQEHKIPLMNKLMALGSNLDVGSVVNTIESVVGKLDDVHKVELENQLQEYLSDNNLEALSIQVNGAVDLAEAQSLSRFNSGWRPFFAWGLAIEILFFGAIYLGNDIFIAINTGIVPPIPAFLITMMSILLGAYMKLRTDEKNQS